jgi:hypothetical protein
MSKLIEEHIYYFYRCPLNSYPLLISSCVNCPHYLRKVFMANDMHPGSPEHEKIVCTWQAPKEEELIKAK